MAKNKGIKGFSIAKRLSMLFMSICILLGNIISYGDVALAAVYESEEVVIEAGEIVKNGTTIFNGQVREEEEISDLHDGIIRLLSEETAVVDNFAYGNNEYSNENSIFSKSCVQINVNKANLTNIIVAEGDITINASEISSGEYTIIYSKSGNINFNTGKMNFNGIVYAPYGKVSFSASNVLINGFVCASKVNIATGVFQINGTKEHSNVVEKLEFLSNDMMFEMFCHYDEDTDEYSIEIDNGDISVFDTIDVYVRYDDGEFIKLRSLSEFENDGTLEKYETVDIVLKGKTLYNEIEYSNISSFALEDDIIKYAKFDRDEDGITDGDEVLFTKTNPDKKDSDNDGISDDIECFYLYTNPLSYTEDGDYDNDGISNFEEMEFGTNPFLNDCDMDGILDGEDAEPLIYDKSDEAPAYDDIYLNIGKFDKIINGYADDGQFYQYVYNHLTGIVKSNCYGDREILYFYDVNDREIADIRKYQGNTRVNSTKYDKKGNIVSHSNNGDVYLYAYDEYENVIDVKINGNRIISKSEKRILYGNGDEKLILDNENGYQYKINGQDIFSWVYESDEKHVKTDEITGIIYEYNYTGESLNSIYSNTGYGVSYRNDGEKYTVLYQYGDESKVQNIYEPDYSKSDLISGDKYIENKSEEGMEYSIYNNDNTVLRSQYVCEDGRIVKVLYNDQEGVLYTYNGSGQILSVTECGKKIIDYNYNVLGHLTKVFDYRQEIVEEYKYDMYGNLMEVNTYDMDDQTGEPIKTDTYKYNSDISGDVLSSYNGKEIKYDEIGNPLSYYDGKSFVWSGRNLDSVKDSAINVEYSYNQDGIRTSKTVNGKTTYYYMDGNDVIVEASDEHIIWYIYDEKTDLLGFIYEDENYYYKKSVTGDVMEIVDNEGDYVCGYEYDAWGNVLAIKGNEKIGNVNPIRYKSYYYDSETGFYYLRSRYYDPQVRRFINMDDVTMLQYKNIDVNLYAYCYGDPINISDPNGMAGIKAAVFSIEDFSDKTDILCLNIYQYTKGTATIYYDKMNNDYKEKRDKFVQWWNKLNGINIVFLAMHGNPTSVSFQKKGDALVDEMRAGFMGDMKTVDVDVLVLLGCNCGHIDFWTDGDFSIARFFASRISGVVIASDGTVYPQVYVGGEIVMFNSKKDSIFDRFAGRDRDNLGWIVFDVDRDENITLNIKSLAVTHVFQVYQSRIWK